MVEDSETNGQKELLGWGQFWLRSVAIFIPYVVLEHIITPLTFTLNTRDPLKIFVFYFLTYLSTYAILWAILIIPVTIVGKVSPRLRALPISHILSKVVPYVLILCGLAIYGQWYGGR
jgi:hypothetical protein